MDSSIDLTGTTLDIENDHVSDNAKKSHHFSLIQFMIFLCDNHQEILSFVGPIAVANNKDIQHRSRFFCMKSVANS